MERGIRSTSSQEAGFKVFLPNKLYSTWTSYEEDQDRIQDLKQEDGIVPTAGNRNQPAITAEQAGEESDQELDKG